MVRVSAIVGVAASVVLSLSSGVYAAEGAEKPLGGEGQAPTLLSMLGGGRAGRGLSVGQSVDLDLMGRRYRVTRSEGAPDVLEISVLDADGKASHIGFVSIPEVMDTVARMQKDEGIFLDALSKGETVKEAIEDVAAAEGLSPEQTENLEETVAAVATLVRDEMEVLKDQEKLEEDAEKLAGDLEALQGQH
ncbi:unnamed protein product [Neospora caninum Liverpool]|uniref:Dense granule protein 1 / major antigenp24,putative n=1 Tax=Neospora caninum (strain Liverpool) TaxID=572307 RepID=F0VJE7_NEOCL|nr:uncharacterized protein NCLIV_036400 [Neospora caninum Liverpool]CBZ53858.1 unnamed protein product [Neospora caninum Liverpool]CEL67853.1 TPA: dense granule protein 1 / major antigenp24,putative [Neospora caninum Liverpool]|eukprot:XP_003883890.1 uncharacterized protein NCLIV_036400 [Neospora caninum Liverpool]